MRKEIKVELENLVSKVNGSIDEINANNKYYNTMGELSEHWVADSNTNIDSAKGKFIINKLEVDGDNGIKFVCNVDLECVMKDGRKISKTVENVEAYERLFWTSDYLNLFDFKDRYEEGLRNPRELLFGLFPYNDIFMNSLRKVS